MSKKIRNYIFIIFIISFLVETLSISLSASGYKLNLHWPLSWNHLLTKTGIIVVDSSPSGATIYLNGKTINNYSFKPWAKKYLLTNNRIKNIIPSEYNLELKLKGYWPLSKKINVYSGKTTFTGKLNLFRNNLPLLLSKTKESKINVSKDYKYLYINKLGKIINLENKDEYNLGDTGKGQWTNNNLLLLKGKLFNPDGSLRENNNYQQKIGDKANNWYYQDSTKRLYYRNKQLIAYLDTNSQKNKIVAQGTNYNDYFPYKNSIFLINLSPKQTILEKRSNINNSMEQNIVLPRSGDYKFIHQQKSFIVLYDKLNRSLYLIDPQRITNNKITINNINSWDWPDDKNIIYNNDWEIYLFNLSHNKKTLITRVAKKIKKIILNKQKNYLIFSTADTIYVYDLENKLETKIFQSQKISSPILDSKNNVLYFWAKIGKQMGVYSFLLQ